MGVEQMREALKSAPRYHGSSAWCRKVDQMPEKQVKAIYYRMLRAGELGGDN